MEIITNNVPREIIDWYDLTEEERKEFDYVNETDGTTYSFFRYKGNVYDLGDCEVSHYHFKEWSGFYSGTFFSGVVFRYVNDMEQVIVGRYYT